MVFETKQLDTRCLKTEHTKYPMQPDFDYAAKICLSDYVFKKFTKKIKSYHKNKKEGSLLFFEHCFIVKFYIDSHLFRVSDGNIRPRSEFCQPQTHRVQCYLTQIIHLHAPVAIASNIESPLWKKFTSNELMASEFDF